MPSKAKGRPAEPQVPAAMSLEGLLRAAVADYRARLRADFKPGTEGLIPQGERGTWGAKWNALKSVKAVLHHLVLAAHGGGPIDSTYGYTAVEIDGCWVIIDGEADIFDGETVHVVEKLDVLVY